MKILAIILVLLMLFGCASNQTPKNQSNHTSNGITTSDNGNNITLNSTNSSKVSGSESGSQVVDVGGSIGMHKS